MYSLRILVLCCSVVGVFGSELTLEDRDRQIWGCSSHENDTSIRPFTVQWSKDEIIDLRYRLNHARAPTQSLTKSFQYGFNSDVLRIWIDYWANAYNFTERVKYLNQYPQYITTIQGLDIHFIRIKPEVDCNCEVKPLLILHGFPSSVAEYFYMIRELIKMNKDCVNGYAVEIVAASMPGHYYSSAPTKPGCGAPEVATIMKNLMKRLGHDKFFIHSNDCVHVDSMIATLYPEAVLGLHTSNPITFDPFSWALWLAGALSSTLTPRVITPQFENTMYPIWKTVTRLMNDLSSIHLLIARPDTIGAALSDSPCGLLAFELTFASWLNRPCNVELYDGGLFAQFERDIVLDEITVYWFTNCIGTAGRIFTESLGWRVFETGLYSKPTHVPTWALIPEYNYVYQSPIQLRLKFPNLVGTEISPCTGHYPAYEKPKFTANSIMKFIALTTEWYSNNNTICEMQMLWDEKQTCELNKLE